MLRIGVIGAGRVAQVCHLATFSALGNARIVALADLRADLAALVAARYAIPTVYRSHAELLADPAIDAVVVVTQRSQTAAVVADALRAGKHVLSEKPMAQSVAEAEALVRLAQAGGRVYAVGYMKRHDGGVRAARAAIARLRATGEAGGLVGVRVTMDGGTAFIDDAAWVMTPEPRIDAGFVPAPAPGIAPAFAAAYEEFLNVFSHTTNVARFVAGDDVAFVAAEVRGGAIAAIAGGPGYPVTFSFANRPVTGWHESVAVFFERASVRIDLPQPFDPGASASVVLEHAGGRRDVLSEPGWAFALQARDVVADILEGRETVAPGSDAVRDVAFCESLWRSLDPLVQM